MTGAHPAAAHPLVALRAAHSSEPDTGGKK
jgi:hypothetical protein